MNIIYQYFGCTFFSRRVFLFFQVTLFYTFLDTEITNGPILLVVSIRVDGMQWLMISIILIKDREKKFITGVMWINCIQAWSILMIANKEMEERVRTPSGSEPYSPTLQSPQNMLSPGTSLSMKRSLQSFLQKRKNRIQEASP